MSEVHLRIEGNRAVLTGKLGKILLQLSQSLEGQKRWVKTGGFSFEATPMNLERAKSFFPEAVVDDKNASSDKFEQLAEKTEKRVETSYHSLTKPFPFQSKALSLSLGSRAYAVLGEMGTGKSKILIDTAGHLWCDGLIDAVLIVAPKGVHTQWVEEEIPKHMGPMVDWQGAAIDVSKTKKPEWQNDKLAIMAVNVDYPRLDKGYEFCESFIAKFRGRVLMIVDESHKIKTLSSQRTQNIIALGRKCSFRRIATGTPISKNLVDAFSQFSFLDPAILGQKYITSFRAEYCIMGGYEMREVIAHKNIEQFYSRISPFSFRITKEEADLGLPPKNYIRKTFEMSQEQKHHYLAMKADMITRMDDGEFVTVTSALPQLTRLQQIACGFLSDGVKLQRVENSRIDALKEVIEEREGKIIIWCRFNEDILWLKSQFGNSALTYYGDTSVNDREIAKQRFLDPDDKVRFLIANPSAGGTGLNLQGDCRTVIYYSNSFNSIDRWQSEDRVHRIGAKGAITYIDLIAKGTIDTKILSNLRNKKSISDLAFDDIRQLLDS